MFEAAQLDPDVRRAYLERLGLEAEPASVDGLRLLAQRQVERVPYETMWIQAGEGWGIDPFNRNADRCRRSWWLLLPPNGALGLLLSSLGYQLQGHVGGVHGPEGPTDAVTGNHLVLTVHGLPSPANPAGVWYVDAGLGDALHDPLPLTAGIHEQRPFRLSLEAVNDSGWHLTHAPVEASAA